MFKGKLKNDSTLVVLVWIIFFIFNILMYTMLKIIYCLPDKYENKIPNMVPTFHDSLCGFIVFDILTFSLLIFITIDWKIGKEWLNGIINSVQKITIYWTLFFLT